MVEVRIAAARLLKFDSEVHRGMLVLRELREAGMPVVGSLFPLGVGRASWRSSTTSSCLTSGYGVGLMPSV